MGMEEKSLRNCVTKIYAKLGVARRGALGDWVPEGGLKLPEPLHEAVRSTSQIVASPSLVKSCTYSSYRKRRLR
jgi:hypothetical protein